MRLRRLEFVVIGLTLAFAFFMGGFFTGRSWSAVNITAVSTQNDTVHGIGINLRQPESPAQPATNDTPAINEPVAADPATPLTSPENPEPAQTVDTIGTPRSGDGRININLASQSELTDLPGIGNALASRIIDYRRLHGDFQRIEDIKNVSGIGEKRFEAIQDKIIVN